MQNHPFDSRVELKEFRGGPCVSYVIMLLIQECSEAQRTRKPRSLP